MREPTARSSALRERQNEDVFADSQSLPQEPATADMTVPGLPLIGVCGRADAFEKPHHDEVLCSAVVF